MMEGRIIEYPRSGGLDYHHNSPLIGEIPTNDYTHFHRSIDQLRSLNERGILNSNHFQNVLVPCTTSPIVVQASAVYSEIKINEDNRMLSDYQSSNKSLRRNGDQLMDEENVANDYQQKKDAGNVIVSNYRLIHSPQQYTMTTSSISPIDSSVQNNHHQQNNFVSLEPDPDSDNQTKPKVWNSMNND